MTSLTATIGSRTVRLDQVAPRRWLTYWHPDRPHRLAPGELQQFTDVLSRIDGSVEDRSYDHHHMESAVATSPWSRNTGRW